MMASRERASTAMAAIERRVPSLDDFVGKNWSTWAERAGVAATDALDVENCSKNGKKAAEAMSLSKEDMSIFGLYPGHDDFYLVVCSHCGQVVKPQAFEEHCERRHSTLAKLYARLHSAPQPQQRPHLSHFPSHGTNPASASSWEGRGQSTSHLQAASPSASAAPQYRHSKHSKDAVRHSTLEKLSSYSSHTESSTFKQLSPLEPPISSPPPSLRDPPWLHASTPPGRPSGDQPSIQSQRRDGSLSSAVPAHRIPRPYNKVASKRECDLDKHCGVLDPDRKKVCTRLLTCNIHSIHQRRKVVGRSKNFDQLVAELKTKVREKGAHLLLGGGSSGVQSPSPETREQTGTPHCRRVLASLPTFSRSTAVSECSPEVESQWQDEGTDPAPSPLVCGRISSDDSDADGPEEYLEFPYSTTHPRPLSVCSFGSHVFGHGFFTFDRRLHHLRSALSNMLEMHISSHRWKKIPQAVDFQATASSSKIVTSSTPCTIATTLSSTSSRSTFQIGSHIHSGGNSGGSIDCGPHRLSPGKHAMSVCQMGPEQSKNPVEHPSKPILKLRVEAASAAALRKRKAPSQEGEHSGPDRNCIILEDQVHPRSATTCSLSSHSKVPGPSPLPHGQNNGVLSPSSKPRPQHPPSESTKSVWTYRRTNSSVGHSSSLDLSSSSTSNSHSRVGMGDSGLHEQGTVRCFDRQGHVKVHKGGSIEEYSPPTKSLAHHLPSGSSATSSPRSNFYLWKDSKGGGLAGGVEKKLGMQKVSLV